MSNHRKQKFGSLEDAIKVFDKTQADYQATKKGRFNKRREGLPSLGGSADYHIRTETEYYDTIEDCYDLERNDSVVGQLLNRKTSNIIQDGFRLEPDTGDKGVDRELKERWNDFAEDPDQCDISGESNFHDFEFAASWTMDLAGDCAVSITRDGPLQFFEPYLIRRDYSNGDDTFLGVDQDLNRNKHRYWIATDDLNPYNTSLRESVPVETRDEYGRRQLCHIYDRKRFSLTRGMSVFMPIFELTGMLEDVNFAKLVQQQIVSCVAFLIEESLEQQGNPMPSTTSTGLPTMSENRPTDTRVYDDPAYDEVAPGMVVNPGAGKKVTGFSPNIPNAEYFQQYRLILQLICGALDLPLSVGMLDGSESTFHGFIGASNEAKKLWRRSQKRLAKRLHRPVYHAKQNHFCCDDRSLRRASKRLKHFGRHGWHFPIWQSVKPLDDTQDRLMRLRNAIISPTKMHAEMNVNYEDHVTETVRDNMFAVRSAKLAAMTINTDPDFADDNQPVHWQQLYPMPMPDGIQATTEIVKEDVANDENPIEPKDKPEPKPVAA